MSFFKKPSKPLPPGHPLPAVDSRGIAIAVGDLVTIEAVPESLTHDLPDDEAARLRSQVGTQMRIIEIDAYGYLWFGHDGPWFSLKPSDVTAVSRRE